MNNRSQLLRAVEQWQAVKGNSALGTDSKEWKDAHEAYENALYDAGVYKEALRGQRTLNEEVRTHTEEPEHTFYLWAYRYASLTPDTLKALHKAKSYPGRVVILDGIQAKLNRAEQKKEEARKADCQRRIEALVEEARIQAHHEAADKMRVEQHKAELAAKTLARPIARQDSATAQLKVGKRKQSA
jgi:hypothetical protein